VIFDPFKSMQHFWGRLQPKQLCQGELSPACFLLLAPVNNTICEQKNAFNFDIFVYLYSYKGNYMEK